MIMYEDNARLINATLAAIAPKATLQTIPLGRLDAMITLRHWLDGGGVAGLLGDRTLPVSSQRSRNHVIDFLGAPAKFSDGPFRLAAMLRRPVVFMCGLYHGANRYELRFMPLADFRGADASNRDALIEDALRRYVATLEATCREAPYNWFNFFDFWSADTAAADAR
jgi:predicted LPLAT superfamily acyltransferase